VHIARLVLVKVIQGRRRALNAVPVNSTTWRVLVVANRVSVRRTLVPKEETRVVSIARSGGRLQKAVRNVIRVMPAHLAKRKVFVQHVQLDFIKTTKVKKNVSNATVENHTSMPKQPAVIVTKVNLAVTMALVQHVRLASFKIPKVKRNAVTLVPRLEKYPTMKARGVNCHRGVPAKQANI